MHTDIFRSAMKEEKKPRSSKKVVLLSNIIYPEISRCRLCRVVSWYRKNKARLSTEQNKWRQALFFALFAFFFSLPSFFVESWFLVYACNVNYDPADTFLLFIYFLEKNPSIICISVSVCNYFHWEVMYYAKIVFLKFIKYYIANIGMNKFLKTFFSSNLRNRWFYRFFTNLK